MANTKTMLFEVAKAEVGYLEKKSNSKLGGKTDNAGWANYTKYARDMDNIPDFFNGPKNGYDWCAVFVCWCFMKAYGAVSAMEMLFLPKRNAGASCTYLASRFKAQGKLFAADPQPGDLALYTRDGGRTFYHIGIVTKVTDKKLRTIEGNTSGGSSVIANGGGVFEKEYDRKAVTAWYARPDYNPEEAAPAPVDPEPEKKPLEEIARAVIDGKYGDGDDRKLKLYAEGYNPKEVQDEVNRILSGKKPAPAEPAVIAPKFGVGATYALQVDKLSVRENAGTQARRKGFNELTANARENAYSTGYLKRGTVVTCLETKVVNGNTWMRIPSGWIAAHYNGSYYVK